MPWIANGKTRSSASAPPATHSNTPALSPTRSAQRSTTAMPTSASRPSRPQRAPATPRPPRYTRHTWAATQHAALAGRMRAYRAGYRPEERRELERAFLCGELLGLVSTNALELGVDIGGVDAAVIAGYPGTVASTWQQAGRAGRSQGSSLALLV